MKRRLLPLLLALVLLTGLADIYYPGTQARWNAIDGVALAGIPGTAAITYNYVPPAAP